MFYEYEARSIDQIVDDYDENGFTEDELMTEEEQAEFEASF
jgi:hypothetical protein